MILEASPVPCGFDLHKSHQKQQVVQNESKYAFSHFCQTIFRICYSQKKARWAFKQRPNAVSP